MSGYHDVPLGAVLPVFFDSFAGSTGASATISGLAVTDIEIYKGVSMTQRSSDNGYTLLDTDGIDLDGITGIQGFSIDTGDNSDAGFFAAGSFYNVVVSAITVDSQTVNFVADRFRIVPAETIAGVPKVDVSHLLGTAWLTPGTAGTPDVNVKLWNGLTTVALPLVPGTAGRTLLVDASGKVVTPDTQKVDVNTWLTVAPLALSSQQVQAVVPSTQKVDVETIKTRAVVAPGTVTFQTGTLPITTDTVLADIRKIGNVPILGDGSGTPFNV